MALRKEEQARLDAERDRLPEEAKQMRRNFALMMLEKLDAQIRRGRITNSPRKDSRHGLSAGS
jgi:hypothetical protein